MARKRGGDCSLLSRKFLGVAEAYLIGIVTFLSYRPAFSLVKECKRPQTRQHARKQGSNRVFPVNRPRRPNEHRSETAAARTEETELGDLVCSPSRRFVRPIAV
jgi:hypothetical protein